MIKISEIKRFRERVNQLGEDYNEPRFIHYAERLREQEAAFNVASIGTILAEFP